MYFHFLLDDQGYDLLAGLFKRTAIDEMIHVEKLAERILFLKGEVEMKVGGEVEKIKDPAKMLEKAATPKIKGYSSSASTYRSSKRKRILLLLHLKVLA